MTIIQKINNIYKKNLRFLAQIQVSKIKFDNFNLLIFFSFLVVFSIIFFSITNLVSKNNKENKNNLIKVTKSSEFSNLTDYFISKINSPYEEVRYTIKNNDSVEKILKNYNIKSEDIKNISTKLKEKKFSKYLFW